MATNTNFNRIYWAITAFGVAEEGTSDTIKATASGTQFGNPRDAVYIRGVQSVGITTNFNLEQVFQLGQLAVYEDVEEVPDIEVSVERVLDGVTFHDKVREDPGINSSNGPPPNINQMHCHLLYGHVTQLHASSIPTMQNNKCDVYLSLNRDSDSNAGDGRPDAYVYCSGMYVSSASWTFATDGNVTESITLVGNHKVWTTNSGDRIGEDLGHGDHEPMIGGVQGGGGANPGDVDDSDATLAADNLALPSGTTELMTGDVMRRQNVSFVNKPSIFDDDTQITSCTVSVDFGREQINVLGKKLPYYRYVSYPVEVSSEWEVLARGDEGLNAFPERTILSEFKL